MEEDIRDVRLRNEIKKLSDAELIEWLEFRYDSPSVSWQRNVEREALKRILIRSATEGR